MELKKIILTVILVLPCIKTQPMGQLESPSPTPDHEDGSYPKVISSNNTIIIYQCIFGRGIIGVQWFVNEVAFELHMDIQNATHYITEATVPTDLIATSVKCCLQNDAGMNICHTRVVNTEPPYESTTTETESASTLPSVQSTTDKMFERGESKMNSENMTTIIVTLVVTLLVIMITITVAVLVTIIFKWRKHHCGGQEMKGHDKENAHGPPN